MATILVTGATGFVGHHLVAALRADGHDVRCASRDPVRARAAAPEVDWVELDLLRPNTLAPALAGCEVAFFLVHAMGPEHGDDYPARERESAHAFIEAAASAGVRKVIYLGGVMPRSGASRHLRSRQRTGEILRAGQVETLELRAAMIIGAGSASWVMVRDLSRRLPAMVLPRWLRNTSHPIAIQDVVHGLVAAISLPAAASRIYELPGPERLTHRDLLRRTAAAMGRRRLMINVPILTPRLSSYWIALVTRTPLAMAKELVEGVRWNLDPTGTSLWDHVDHTPMPIDLAIRSALADEGDVPPPRGGGDVTGAAGRSWPGAIVIAVATIAFATALVLRERVDPWRSTAAAALLSGALAWWALRGRARPRFAITSRGAAIAIAVGVALVATTHAAYQLATSLVPALETSVRGLYASVEVPSSRIVLAALTAVVVLGEELVWRGVAIEQSPGNSPLAIGAVSVGLYVLPQIAGGVPLLIVAAALLGTLFAAQRLVTGTLAAPLLTHLVWSLSVFVVVPLH